MIFVNKVQLGKIWLLVCLLFTTSFNQVSAVEVERSNESEEQSDHESNESEENTNSTSSQSEEQTDHQSIDPVRSTDYESSEPVRYTACESRESEECTNLRFDFKKNELTYYEIDLVIKSSHEIRQHPDYSSIVPGTDSMMVTQLSDDDKKFTISMHITVKTDLKWIFSVRKTSQTIVKITRSTYDKSAMEKEPFNHFIITNTQPHHNVVQGAMFINSILPEGCSELVFPIKSYGKANPYYTITDSESASFIGIKKTSAKPGSLNYNHQFHIDNEQKRITFNSGHMYTMPLWIQQASFRPLEGNEIEATTLQQVLILESPYENSYLPPDKKKMQIRILKFRNLCSDSGISSESDSESLVTETDGTPEASEPKAAETAGISESVESTTTETDGIPEASESEPDSIHKTEQRGKLNRKKIKTLKNR